MKILKTIYLGLAFIFLFVGAIGIFLPVLPTTPFLLLSSFFFAKSSKRFNEWFLGTKLYEKHLENFVKNRSMTLTTKLSILIPVSLMLAIAFYFAPIWPARVFIIGVVIFKYYYFIFCIQTIKSNKNPTKMRDNE
ncbi:MAG: YbaN family protein [Acetobacterium sp.]